MRPSGREARGVLFILDELRIWLELRKIYVDFSPFLWWYQIYVVSLRRVG